MCAKELVTGKFLFMYADDVHGAAALAEVVEKEHAMLAMPSDTPEQFGVVYTNEDGTLKGIVEKPEQPESNLVNIGGFVITPEIFDYEASVNEGNGEIYVTDMLTEYGQTRPV